VNKGEDLLHAPVDGEVSHDLELSCLIEVVEQLDVSLDQTLVLILLPLLDVVQEVMELIVQLFHACLDLI
jgi:hypothetical protein